MLPRARPSTRAWTLGIVLILSAAGCTGEIAYSTAPELPSEPLHYVIVRVSKAPEPDAVGAHEWARSRHQRFALWSVAAAGPAGRLGLLETVVALLAEETPTSRFARGLFDGLWTGYGDDTEIGWDGEPARAPDLFADALMMTTRRLPS